MCKCAVVTIIKAILVLINGKLFILGLLMLGIGTLGLSYPEFMKKDYDFTNISMSPQQFESIRNLLRTIFIYFVVFGALTALISFCGCFGALCGIKLLLFVYIILVSMCFVSQLGSVISFGVKRNKTIGKILPTLKNRFTTQYIGWPSNTSLESIAADIFMVTQKCCGFDGPQDFRDNTSLWYQKASMEFKGIMLSPRNNTLFYPITCCKLGRKRDLFKKALQKIRSKKFNDKFNTLVDKVLPQNDTNICPLVQDQDKVHSKGCLSVVKRGMLYLANIIQIIAILILALEVAVVVLSILLWNLSKKSKLPVVT